MSPCCCVARSIIEDGVYQSCIQAIQICRDAWNRPKPRSSKDATAACSSTLTPNRLGSFSGAIFLQLDVKAFPFRGAVRSPLHPPGNLAGCPADRLVGCCGDRCIVADDSGCERLGCGSLDWRQSAATAAARPGRSPPSLNDAGALTFVQDRSDGFGGSRAGATSPCLSVSRIPV